MRIARTLRRTTAAGAALAAGLAFAVLPATPAQATTCHWEVMWTTAGVYPEPDRYNYSSLKTKQRGDIVGPYCTTIWNAGEYWVAVHCTCDTWDHVGWMRYDALRYAGA